MNLYLIETKNGKFISMGNDEKEAGINFTTNYPSEKARSIIKLEGNSVWINEIL